MEITIVGTDFRTAPVHIREALYLPGEAEKELLRTCRREGLFQEGMLLNTCNRTEAYVVTRDGQFPLPRLLKHIARLKGTAPVTDLSIFFRRDGLDAVSHLLRVATSLESQIVGEHEILGQVREAFRRAREAGTARFVLDRLAQRAFRAGKRVRTETELGSGSASIASASVDLGRHVFSGLGGKTVLLLGAGRTAELVARALIRAGSDSLIVANRTLSRARELVAKFAGEAEDNGAPEKPLPTGWEREGAGGGAPATARAVTLSDLPDVLGEADLVIASTAATEYVLTGEVVEGALRDADHPVLMIDIAVPRDIDPALGELGNVFLYTIDDLDRLVRQNLAHRRGEIQRAEAIVRHEAGQFDLWLRKLALVPTIKQLRRRVEELRLEEVARRSRGLAPAERARLERLSRSLCTKMLHAPLSFLHRTTRNGDEPMALEALELVRRMFDLDAPEGSQ